MTGSPPLHRALVEFVAIALLGIAVAMVLVADLPQAFTYVATLDVVANESARAAMFVGVGVACIVWVLWTTPSWSAETNVRTTEDGTHPPDFEALRRDPPEAAAASPVVGERFDTRIESAVQAARSGDEDPIRERLQSMAVEAIVHSDDCSRSSAKSMLSEGDWTDDAVAAAYLADREATLPFVQRLLAWLQPVRTRRRRIERAVEAIDERLGRNDRR
ncbi:hypothetical protein KY092_20860 [Natronomonas gomsonensis]|uniref:DUF7269 family protein n=1 Tax=Natronomonas gomsonensis TaxID=1046043 RepID=UPI00227D3B89|nr:hypothetical protein [Natronomonas gomsonensis]MCY4732984.1 hypothetical protein [Natronomonas gomsonensis]